MMNNSVQTIFSPSSRLSGNSLYNSLYNSVQTISIHTRSLLLHELRLLIRLTLTMKKTLLHVHGTVNRHFLDSVQCIFNRSVSQEFRTEFVGHQLISLQQLGCTIIAHRNKFHQLLPL